MNRFCFIITLAFVTLAASCGGKDDKGNRLDISGAIAEITGTVRDQNGNPLSGILMTDGYTQVRTGLDGKYSISHRSKDAFYIYYSIPADAVIGVNSTGRPDFYQRLQLGQTRYDFTITKQAVENKVRLLFIGDPQVRPSNNGLSRFGAETAPDIKKFVASKGGDMPTYAFAMGDMVHNTWDQLRDIFALVSKDNIGVPCFGVIGNHDHEFGSADAPVSDIKGQHKWEAVAGPVNYSLERGNTHILVLDDIIHQGISESSFTEGLTDEIKAFMKEDLRLVDRNKTLLLVMHAYLDNTEDYADIWSLISEFKCARIIGAHLHSVRNYYYPDVNGKAIHGNVVGTANGVDWAATVCGDGAPMGYAVMEMQAGEIQRYYYKPTCLDENFQIRLYRADDFPAFSHTLTGGATVTFKFTQYGTGVIIANIWNWNPLWTVEVYENGIYKGLANKQNMYDVWACKYFYQQKNRSTYSFCQRRDHTFWYKMSDPSATIKFVATDDFGQVYEQSVITTNLEKDWPDSYK